MFFIKKTELLIFLQIEISAIWLTSEGLESIQESRTRLGSCWDVSAATAPLPRLSRASYALTGGRGSRQIDLGDARQLAGKEANVTAYIDNRTEEARTVFISRRSPITLEELGIKTKPDRERRSRRRSKK